LTTWIKSRRELETVNR